tara:strand:+ start:862 stop:1047 length:186 start_codon:yes stop_codon:yes gene_type:complete
MVLYVLKWSLILAYWILACHLFFTETTDPKIAFGVLSMAEALGLIFVAFGFFLLFALGWKR